MMKTKFITSFFPWVGGVALLLSVTSVSAKDYVELAGCYRQAETQAEVTDCLEQELKMARDDHDRMEDRVMERARDLDRIAKRKKAVPAFTAANKAFDTYLKNQCAWVQASYGSAKGSEQGKLACQINLLRERTGQLEAEILARSAE